MRRYCWLLLFILPFSACDNLVKKNQDDSEKSTKTTARKKSKEAITTNSDADILNNIELFESGGLKVAQAYLAFDDGKLIPKSNIVPVGRTINLTLAIEEGWEIRDGEASIDATQIITTDQGEIVLNAPNLFRSKPTLKEADANRVFLKATITKTRPDIEYFVVNYRVWDKWGDAEVKGSYKFYVEEESEETE